MATPHDLSTTLPTTGRVNGRIIPSTGERIGIIGCGTYRGFDVYEDSNSFAPLERVVTTLLNGGGSVMDSSPMYGRSEATTGAVLASLGRRDEAFIATKVWTRGRRTGIDQMKRSLELLRTPFVDLMQVHNLVDVGTHLDTLAGWKQDGLTRYVGVTHYHGGAFAELETVLRRDRVDFVQFNYSLEDREAEKRLLPLARERGVAVLVNVPLGGGALLDRVSRRLLPDFAARIGCTSWSQLLLKFVLGHEDVTCAIPGTGNPQHMADNLAAGCGDLAQARNEILTWWNRDMR